MHPPCLTPSDSRHFGCTGAIPPQLPRQADRMPAATPEPAHRAAVPETHWKPAPGQGAGARDCTHLQKGKHLGLGTGCRGDWAGRGITPGSRVPLTKPQPFSPSRADVVPVLSYSELTENTKKSLQSYWSCQGSLTGRTIHVCSQLKTLFGCSNSLKAKRNMILWLLPQFVNRSKCFKLSRFGRERRERE